MVYQISISVIVLRPRKSRDQPRYPIMAHKQLATDMMARHPAVIPSIITTSVKFTITNRSLCLLKATRKPVNLSGNEKHDVMMLMSGLTRSRSQVGTGETHLGKGHAGVHGN